MASLSAALFGKKKAGGVGGGGGSSPGATEAAKEQLLKTLKDNMATVENLVKRCVRGVRSVRSEERCP